MSHAEIETGVNKVQCGGEVCQKKVSRNGSRTDRRMRCTLTLSMLPMRRSRSSSDVECHV